MAAAQPWALVSTLITLCRAGATLTPGCLQQHSSHHYGGDAQPAAPSTADGPAPANGTIDEAGKKLSSLETRDVASPRLMLSVLRSLMALVSKTTAPPTLAPFYKPGVGPRVNTEDNTPPPPSPPQPPIGAGGTAPKITVTGRVQSGQEKVDMDNRRKLLADGVLGILRQLVVKEDNEDKQEEEDGGEGVRRCLRRKCTDLVWVRAQPWVYFTTRSPYFRCLSVTPTARNVCCKMSICAG